MVIRLDSTRVDVGSARSVLDTGGWLYKRLKSWCQHVRGRVIATTVGTFLCGEVDLMIPLPEEDARWLTVANGGGEKEGGRMAGFRMGIDIQSMVWHGVTFGQLMDRLAHSQDNVIALARWVDMHRLRLMVELMDTLSSPLKNWQLWAVALQDLGEF